MSKSDRTVWLVYDGECPMCKLFAKTLKIREAAGELQLINGRENHPLLHEINKLGFDLDKGMVVKYNGQFYYGADAQHFLALIGSDYSWINSLNIRLFRSKFLAKLLYPVLRSARNFLLWARQGKKINNLRNDDAK